MALYTIHLCQFWSNNIRSVFLRCQICRVKFTKKKLYQFKNANILKRHNRYAGFYNKSLCKLIINCAREIKLIKLEYIVLIVMIVTVSMLARLMEALLLYSKNTINFKDCKKLILLLLIICWEPQLLFSKIFILQKKNLNFYGQNLSTSAQQSPCTNIYLSTSWMFTT